MGQYGTLPALSKADVPDLHPMQVALVTAPRKNSQKNLSDFHTP
jgi:hypothetical protein